MQTQDMYTQTVSPYDMNPTHYNPLRDLLKDRVNFDEIHSAGLMKLYVSATNVETNRIKIFAYEELCLEALLASSCLTISNQLWNGEENIFGMGVYGEPNP